METATSAEHYSGRSTIFRILSISTVPDENALPPQNPLVFIENCLPHFLRKFPDAGHSDGHVPSPNELADMVLPLLLRIIHGTNSCVSRCQGGDNKTLAFEIALSKYILSCILRLNQEILDSKGRDVSECRH